MTRVWRTFRGDWELQVHARNETAIAFWKSCIEQVARSAATVIGVASRDGRRTQFNFSVGSAEGDVPRKRVSR